MRSQLAAPQGAQVPRVRLAPRVRANSWEDVSDLCAAYGLVLDDWQEGVLEGALGERSDGKWAASQVGVAVPRQNGKGALIEARELAGVLLFGEELLIHSAHQVQTALDGFRRIRSYFENFDDLGKLVHRIRESHTEQGIEFKSGQRLRFMSRSKSSGRGFSADCLILDEAQELSDDTWAAMLPTISARPNPQIWMLGTPPAPTMTGEVFTRIRGAGHEGKERHLGWFEWSCPAGVDLDDPAAWAQSNPALYDRIDVDRVAAERAAMDDDTFARERLGMWGSASTAQVIDPVTWARAADMMSQPVDRLTLAADVNFEQTGGTVAIAGRRDDDRWHVELADSRNGVGWMVERITGITQRNDIRAVVIDKDGPAASLIEPLEAKGVTVTKTGFREIKLACATFYTDTVEDRLRHLDDPRLNASLGGARKRAVGDAWAWHRKNVTVDITPIVAATLALWGAQSEAVAQAKRPSPAYAF